MGKIEIKGTCDPGLTAIKDVFARNFEDGLEDGAAFAVTVEGEPLIDIWAGVKDREGALWEEDTVTLVASTSKVVVSICGLMLVDRGLVDLDTPVAHYWPEFAGGGKGDIPVRSIFCHATGVPGIKSMPPWDVIDNWDEMIRLIGEEEPWFEPGTKTGYQSHIYGHVVGELIRRTTGKTIQEFLKSEIAEPFDIDFTFGLSPDMAPRYSHSHIADADAFFASVNNADVNSPFYKALAYTFSPAANLDYWLSKGTTPGINMPAGNGVTNARAMAKLGGIMACGGRSRAGTLMSPETAALPYQEQIYEEDIVLESRVRFGLGFGISSQEFPFPWPNTFHWGGLGGSFCFMVPEIGAAIAYTPNRMIVDENAEAPILDERGYALKDAVVAGLLAL